MANTVIKVQDLTYSYQPKESKNRKMAVHNVNFEIQEGEHVAILGHNGSGKSTIAKLINLILTPESGKIWIKDKEINSENIQYDELTEIRKEIGMVFQNPDNQLVSTIVEEDVAFGPENLGIDPSEIRQRVKSALRMVGMEKYARNDPQRLSGGQKQRVAIAGILAMMPRCIIFDESTAMLDPKGRKEIINTIRKLNKENGITVINITHYMNEAALADRIIVLKEGSIILEGTPREVFSRPDLLISAGLQVYQSTSLIYALREEGMPLEGDFLTNEGCAESIFNCLKNKG